MCARMKLRERTGPDGSLRPSPKRERLVCGAPAFLWRELSGALFAWGRSIPGRDRGRRLEAEMRVRHLLGYILEQPHVRRSDGMTTARAIAATGMSPRRLVLASLLTLGIVGGSAVDVVRDREHWPFSQYPMFSNIDHSHDHRTLRLHGVVRNSAQEVPLTDFAYVEPFDQCRLSTALSRMSVDRPADLAAAVDGRVRSIRAAAEGRRSRRAAAAGRAAVSASVDASARCRQRHGTGRARTRVRTPSELMSILLPSGGAITRSGASGVMPG